MAAEIIAAPCRWCGDSHSVMCPYVKAFEFRDADPLRVTRVEFLTPVDYGPQSMAREPEPDYPRIGDKPEGT